MWRPNPNKDINGRHDLTENELDVMRVDEKNDGMLMWNTANDMRGNSTRTEIFGLMGAMLSSKAVHTGIDNLVVVKGASRAIEHITKRTRAVLRQANEGLRLGGKAFTTPSGEPLV